MTRQLLNTKSIFILLIPRPKEQEFTKRSGEKKKMNENENTTMENPKILGEVDLPKVNLRQYNGKQSVIESVTYEEHVTHGKYVKVQSGLLSNPDEKPEIRASIILGLVKIEDETTKELKGYGWGKESKTSSFLKKYEAETLQDLVGKKVIVTFEINKKGFETLNF